MGSLMLTPSWHSIIGETMWWTWVVPLYRSRSESFSSCYWDGNQSHRKCWVAQHDRQVQGSVPQSDDPQSVWRVLCWYGCTRMSLSHTFGRNWADALVKGDDNNTEWDALRWTSQGDLQPCGLLFAHSTTPCENCLGKKENSRKPCKLITKGTVPTITSSHGNFTEPRSIALQEGNNG